MDKQKFIEKVSLYRSACSWWYSKGDTENDLDRKYEAFLRTPRRWMSPKVHSFNEYLDYLQGWEPTLDSRFEVLRRIKEFETVPMEESDELIRFQCGTSLYRAEQFIQTGDGHVWAERLIGRKNYSPMEKILGLQVSIPNECRGGIERLYYYSEVQASRTGDRPAVLTGLIPKRYLFPENNAGEWAISIKDFDKIIDPEILSPREYGEKYL